MKEKIENFLKLKEELKKELKEYVKDKKIPLEERWELFVKSKLGNHSRYYYEFEGIDWNRYTLYDDFYTDKYAQITVDAMLETARELEDFDEIAFKKDVLNKFIYSFENDW